MPENKEERKAIIKEFGLDLTNKEDVTFLENLLTAATARNIHNPKPTENPIAKDLTPRPREPRTR